MNEAKDLASTTFVLTPGKCFDASTISTGLPFTSRKSCTELLPV